MSRYDEVVGIAGPRGVFWPITSEDDWCGEHERQLALLASDDRISVVHNEYLTREELATELRITTRTLARWQSQPDGIPTTQAGGRTLFRIDSVRAWLAKRERQPNQRGGF